MLESLASRPSRGEATLDAGGVTGVRAGVEKGHMRQALDRGAMRSGAEWVLRWAPVLQALAITCFLVLFAAGAVFLTAEPDEAWILLSTMKVFGVPVPETNAVASPTATSGGLHAVAHGVLALFSTSILLHRAVSILFSAGLLGLVFAILRALPASPGLALAGTALFAAVPGFVLQAGLATAEVIATTLMLGGLWLWVRWGLQSATGAVWAGVVIGVAAATRVNCVVALPALGLVGLLARLRWRDVLLRSGLAIAIGAVLLGLGLGTYVLAFRVASYGDVARNMGHSTGLAEHKGVSDLLRYLLISNGLLPVFVGVGATATLVGGALSHAQVASRRFCAVLLITAVLGWVLWACRAPIPHVRYLWPFICCLWLAGVMLLVAQVQRMPDWRARLTFHGATLAVCAYQGLASLFLVLNGESLVLVYQLNQMAALTVPHKDLSAAADQRAAAAFLAGLPAGARLYGWVPEADYGLTYLDGRPTGSVREAPGFPDTSFLVVVPGEFEIWPPSPSFTVWLAEYGAAVFRSGRYVVYRIRPDAPVPKF